VRNNALCLSISDNDASSSTSHYDARNFKIQRVAWPIDDDDVTSKKYVARIIRDAQTEEGKQRENIRFLITKLEDSANSSTKDLYAKIDTVQNAANESTRSLKNEISQIFRKENALESRLQTLKNLQALVATKIEVAKRISDLEKFIETTKNVLNKASQDLKISTTQMVRNKVLHLKKNKRISTKNNYDDDS